MSFSVSTPSDSTLNDVLRPQSAFIVYLMGYCHHHGTLEEERAVPHPGACAARGSGVALTPSPLSFSNDLPGGASSRGPRSGLQRHRFILALASIFLMATLSEIYTIFCKCGSRELRFALCKKKEAIKQSSHSTEWLFWSSDWKVSNWFWVSHERFGQFYIGLLLCKISDK